MGSASELQNHLRLAKDLEFLEDAQYAQLFKELTSVRQMLTAFLQRLRGVRVRDDQIAKFSGE
jgi:four helix bundle protein